MVAEPRPAIAERLLAGQQPLPFAFAVDVVDRRDRAPDLEFVPARVHHHGAADASGETLLTEMDDEELLRLVSLDVDKAQV